MIDSNMQGSFRRGFEPASRSAATLVCLLITSMSVSTSSLIYSAKVCAQASTMTFGPRAVVSARFEFAPGSAVADFQECSQAWSFTACRPLFAALGAFQGGEESCASRARNRICTCLGD